MKIKDGFVLTEVGESSIAVPVGAASREFKGVVRLNDTGAFIWKELSEGRSKEQIAEAMLSEYSDIDYDVALKSIEDIIGKMKADGMIEE